MQVKRCSEGCLPPGAGASLGIFGQDPQGMAVNARMYVNDEIMYQLSPALLAGHCHKPTFPPTLSCEHLKDGGSKQLTPRDDIDAKQLGDVFKGSWGLVSFLFLCLTSSSCALNHRVELGTPLGKETYMTGGI